jgi:8-oxo-dGTP pyrophosphatase MutT (NUDIX family)
VRAERDPPFREAAVALILAPADDDLQLLFMRRATHAGDPWSGQISLPGGRFEAHDESLLATAIRETREETAIDLASALLLGELDELRPRTPVLPPIIVRPFVLAVPELPVVSPNYEVAEAFWVPLRALFDPVRTIQTTVETRGLTMRVSAIDFEGRVIWGMTERILRGLEGVLR